MKEIKRRVRIIVSVGCALFAGVIVAHGYAIMSAGGFTPLPATVVPYSGYASSVQSAISNSCSAWNGAGAGTLVKKASYTHSNSTFPLKNSANQITSTNLGTGTGMMQTRLVQVSVVGLKQYNKEVDININTAYPWSTSGDYRAYDVQNCFTHELGHLLGLDEEYSNTESTMYGAATVGETKKRTLAQDDKNGINAIY